MGSLWILLAIKIHVVKTNTGLCRGRSVVSPGLITEEPHYAGAPSGAERYQADRNGFVDPFITETKAVINNK